MLREWATAAVVAMAAGAAWAQAPSAESTPGAWREIPPERMVVMSLPQGRVTIELNSRFAPRHAANVTALARAGFYDGLFVVRVQDDYVVQWGDAEAKKPLGAGARTLAPEFDKPIAAGEAFVPLPDADTYAPQTGFIDGFPVARDPASGREWLAHCYGMVGAGRDNDPASGGGPELYAMIAPARQLDRNVTLLGRVIEGMDILSALPRGRGEMGFYQTAAEKTPIRWVKVAADLPPDERPRFEEMATDSAPFAARVQERRHPTKGWFVRAADRTDVCNVTAPVRAVR